MNKKKIYSALVLVLFATNMVSQSFALSFWENYTFNNTKTQKLLKLNTKLERYIKTESSKKIVKLKNINDKSSYKNEVNEILNDIKDFNWNLAYDHDSNFKNNLLLVKQKARQYKSLSQEIDSTIKTWISPYKISIEEKKKIESDILEIQKNVVSKIKALLDNYNDSSFKESWKANFEVSSEIWKINVEIERYTNIFSILSWSQESDLLVNISFEWNIPWQASYVNWKYIEWEKITISWSASFDVNLKMVDKNLYLNLKDYSITLKSSDENFNESMDLKDMTEYLDKYKGKTIRIKLPEWQKNLNQAETIKNIKSLLDILEKNSILTPFKKLNNEYVLIEKSETVSLLIAKIKDFGKTWDFSKLKTSKKSYKELLRYKSENWKIILYKNINKGDSQWKIQITKENWEYSFEGNIKSKNDSFDFLIKKNSVLFNLISSDITIKSRWENNVLDFTASANSQNIKISWPLSQNNADLKINFNWNDVWYLKIKTEEKKTVYDFNLNLSNLWLDWINSLSIKLNWEYNIEKWDFKVIEPTSYIDIESFDSNSENLPSDFSDL